MLSQKQTSLGRVLKTQSGRSKRKKKTKRFSTFEQLENRRLLVSEGEVFSVTRSFDTTGLVGGLISTVTWGDGTQSAGQISGSLDNNGPLRVRFEYMGSFFNDNARRVALHRASSYGASRASPARRRLGGGYVAHRTRQGR